jgi:methylglutamate dehydrogenase subunit D
MSDRASALGTEFKTGLYGDVSNGAGVRLNETFFGFTAEVAAFPGFKAEIESLIRKAEARAEGSISFQFAQNRWLVAGSTEFRAALENRIGEQSGSFVDLTHGRSAFAVSGPKAAWVLSKLFAVDFREKAFPRKSGLATMHHDVFAQIYRPGEQAFMIFVFRSFARSFWHTLRRAAEEVGYEIC